MIAQSGPHTSIPDADISASARASYTVIEQLEPQLGEGPKTEVLDDIEGGRFASESPLHLDFEPVRRKSVQSRKRKKSWG